MMAFKNKNDLIKAYAEYLSDINFKLTNCHYKTDIEILIEVAKNKLVYAPHIYSGGWVIKNFGYSIERINVYVSTARAGNPYLV